MKKSLIAIITLLVISICQQAHAQPEQFIAVYRITANSPEVEVKATSALTTAISRIAAAHPVERMKLRHALSEEVLRREGIAKPSNREFTGVNSADYLVVGEADLDTENRYIAGGGVCHMHLRLVDTYTGEVVAAVNSYGVSYGASPMNAVAEAADHAATEIAKLFPARGQVMMVDGQLAYVSLTVADGVVNGATVWVFPKEVKAFNPSTGKEIIIRGRHYKAKVVEVSPEYCVIKLDKDAAATLNGGETVELKP